MLGNRLENDFIVFRGGEHESAGQLLKGTVVLCLSNALKLDEVHLRLTGTLRLSYVSPRSGLSPSPSRSRQHLHAARQRRGGACHHVARHD